MIQHIKSGKTQIITFTIICMTLITYPVYSKDNIQTSVPKVLILDFANTTNSSDHRYLETSAPESFSASLSKTKKFEVMDRNIWNNEVAKGNFSNKNVFDQNTAVSIAKKYKADIVIIGSFIVSGGQIQTFAKAIEVSTEKILVNRKTEGVTDANIIPSISKFTEEMSSEMSDLFSKTIKTNSFENPQNEINSLIDDGLEKNKDKIYNVAEKLSNNERLFIFNTKSKNAMLQFIGNGLLGFGIGSIIQGDLFGGIIALCGDFGSLTALATGSYILINPFNNNSLTAQNSTSLGSGLVIGGALAFIGFRVFELMRPWGYSKLYNKMLSESLRINFSVSPNMNTINYVSPQFGASWVTKF